MKKTLTIALALAVVGIAGISATTASGTGSSGSNKSDRHGHDHHHGRPSIAKAWEAAWNNDDPKRLAALFTTDGRYSDHALMQTFKGRDGVTQWAAATKQFVADANVKVNSAFADDGQVAIVWTFSGHLQGAPKPFSVPASTILKMRGDKIVANDDYYNRAEVLAQSGLPADTVFN
ncbi:nuclear transport factor 2 family protein [Streptomyces sp. NPDC058653]|uniref:nuclear transport factor 2 family protein n=1 Tax=Streptomyces sp. NPDC058653 TaxID=3346576 RepID=UPI00366788EF